VDSDRASASIRSRRVALQCRCCDLGNTKSQSGELIESSTCKAQIDLELMMHNALDAIRMVS
jgi:hypothetical protein